MIQKKICMLGSFSVGKTSLVARFVSSVFSEKYLTTVGVKIDKKALTVNGTDVTLMLWDIYGEDDFQKLRLSYLRGASGYLLVVDGTRSATLDIALSLQQRVTDEVGPLPFVICVNKADLRAEWEIDLAVLQERARTGGWLVLETSAKLGTNVEEAFAALASRMLAADGGAPESR
jgi:small GTP-binding protein